MPIDFNHLPEHWIVPPARPDALLKELEADDRQRAAAHRLTGHQRHTINRHEIPRAHLLSSLLISTIVLAVLAPSIDAQAADAAPSAGTPHAAPTIEKWPLALALGGGLNASGHLTGEATFLPDLPGPFISVGYGNTGVGRSVYAEGGVALILSLAAGVRYHLDTAGTTRWGFHLFVGVPIPVIGVGPGGASTPFHSAIHIAPVLVYVEPFYRPEFRKGEAVEHEVGFLLKARIGLTKRQWSVPGLNVMDGFAGIHDL
jgi:hypothetical protein